MKQVNPSNLQLIHSAITHFIGEPIAEMNKYDDMLMFQTASGTTGLIESNYLGNMDIWIGETVVYEIEMELFELLEYDRREIGLIEFYNFLKNVETDYFKEESKQFFDIVKTSTENIILNFDLPIFGDTTINNTQVHYTHVYGKIKINLN